MEPVPASAGLLWRLIEPVHAVTYFAPEPISEFRSAGYRGFWMGYFAGRAAPLGPVGPEVVYALFYNFSFDRVAKARPCLMPGRTRLCMSRSRLASGEPLRPYGGNSASWLAIGA